MKCIKRIRKKKFRRELAELALQSIELERDNRKDIKDTFTHQQKVEWYLSDIAMELRYLDMHRLLLDE